MTTRSRVARAGAGQGGFTLLEVMAAVLILGIWFTVLAGAAIQGLRAEGEADRRLRAEMIADARMSDLEGAAQLGAIPPIGEDEAAEDDFQVHTRVAALDLPAVSAAAAASGIASAGAAGAAAAPDAATGASGSAGSAGAGARSGANALASRLAAQRAARAGGRAGLGARGLTGGAAGGAAGAAAGAAGTTASAALPANASFFAPTPGGGAPPLRQLQVEVVWQDGGVQRSVVRTSYALDAQAAAPLLQALDQAAEQSGAETGSEAPTSPGGPPDREVEGQEPEAGQ